jgi:hypothetical protein
MKVELRLKEVQRSEESLKRKVTLKWNEEAEWKFPREGAIEKLGKGNEKWAKVTKG